MKLLIVILLLAAGPDPDQIKNLRPEQTTLNGTWIPVSQELGGKPLPQTVVQKQKLVIQDSNYTVIAESVDKGVLKFEGNKMDIYGKEGINAGRHIPAIYKIENDQLTICYNLSGNDYPAAFDSKANPKFFLSVFKKE